MAQSSALENCNTVLEAVYQAIAEQPDYDYYDPIVYLYKSVYPTIHLVLLLGDQRELHRLLDGTNQCIIRMNGKFRIFLLSKLHFIRKWV